jgi:hypothetical protein
MRRLLPERVPVRTGLAALCAAAGIGAAAQLAEAGHYHTSCVGHGYVHGSSTGDGSFFARVEAGCGNPGQKTCVLYLNRAPYGSSQTVPAGGTSNCSAWSWYGGRECAGSAHVDFDGVFVSHEHLAHNWCL